MTHTSKRWRHRRRSVRRPMAKPSAPGTVAVDPAAPQPVLTVLAYGPHDFHERKGIAVSDIPQYLGQSAVTWVNVDGLGSAETIHQLGQLFHLHPLALEDVVNTHQRAKTDSYSEVLFVVARMVKGPPLQTEQISLFVGRNFVLTFQEDIDGDCLDQIRDRLRHNRGRTRQAGPDYLLYELLDAIIDSYFPVLETYGDQLDELDLAKPNERVGNILSQLHHLRSDLLYLRRIAWPHRDAVQSLLRGGQLLVAKETEFYLRDCYDHMSQVIDILEIYRENCADLRDFHYSKLSNRTNEIMRTLTVIATLFMPMSFVAGVYGMNFHHMPELAWQFGYPMALTIMACIAVGMLSFFWRRGWLRSTEGLARGDATEKLLAHGDDSHPP